MQKHFPTYTKRLVSVARTLRRHMTDSEKKLWSLLRGNQLGVKFRRQFPRGKHVLDFYSHEAKLNIELDGSQHYTDEGIERDDERDADLESCGIKVMRYSNSEVLQDLHAVIDEIFEAIQARTKDQSKGKGGSIPRPHLCPPLRGEEILDKVENVDCRTFPLLHVFCVPCCLRD